MRLDCSACHGRPLTWCIVRRVCSALQHMKHAKAGPGTLRRVKIQEKTKVGEYSTTDDIERPNLDQPATDHRSSVVLSWVKRRASPIRGILLNIT